MPPSASSAAPGRSSWAPVKAPFTWPKISLSIESLGIAPQLSAMNGPPARGERAWIASAVTSLPVPLSPVTNTGAREGAMRPICSNTSRMAFDAPMKPSKPPSSSGRAGAGVAVLAGFLASNWARRRTRSAGANGFTTTSSAPARIAATASDTEPEREVAIRGPAKPVARIASTASASPSSATTAAAQPARRGSACSSDDTPSATRSWRSPNVVRHSRRTTGSSSTTRTRRGSVEPLAVICMPRRPLDQDDLDGRRSRLPP